VRHLNVVDNYASVITEVPEIITGDDAVKQAEAVDNFIEQLSCLLCSPRD
jgi:hypothetical protein